MQQEASPDSRGTSPSLGHLRRPYFRISSHSGRLGMRAPFRSRSHGCLKACVSHLSARSLASASSISL